MDAGEVSRTDVMSLEVKRSESEHDKLCETEMDEVSESIDHVIVASSDKHRTSEGGGKALGVFSITGLLVHSSSEAGVTSPSIVHSGSEFDELGDG